MLNGYVCVCDFLVLLGHMYSSVPLVQTSDLDLREEVNWCFNECNRCEHIMIHWRRLVLLGSVRNI